MGRLVLEGRFDFSAQREFRRAAALIFGNPELREVEIDLAAVDYVDSSALGMLLLARESAEQADRGLTLVNCEGLVRHVLRRANLGRAIAIR